MKQNRLSRAFLFIILALGALSLLFPAGCDKLVTEVTNNTVYDTTLGQACLTCHSDASNLFARPQAQWENSRHANADLLDISTPINGKLYSVNQCGAQCHSHEKFVKDIDSVAVAVDQLSPITCFTCHKPHSGAYGTWSIDSLRGWDTYVRLANDSVYNMGKSNSCAHCHRAVGEPPVAAAGVDSVLLAADWGPHWSPQAEVVEGKGGHQFSAPGFEGKHHLNVKTQNGCLKCHFGTGQGTRFAEHTFRLEDTTANQQFVSNCNQAACHVGGAAKVVTDFYDFPVLDSIAGYADSLEALLRGRNILDSTDASGLSFYADSWVRVQEAQILFNYLMYRMDGSRGIHNPEYMEFLLKQSVAYWDSIPPEARFVANVTSGCVPFDVQFTATYSGLIDSVRWNFDDGTTDTALQPLHAFTTPGFRSVTLRVYGPGGIDVATRTNYITAQISPAAIFTADQTTGCDTLAVQFTSTSTGTIESWVWDFGDNLTSGVEDPIHTYQSPGVYTVTLITSGPCGADTATDVDMIRVAANPPSSQFAVDTAIGCDSLVVTFTNQSTGDIDSWKYLFGDGDSATVQNPTHMYRSLGAFNPRLITTGACGVDTSVSGAVEISVTTLPIAAFSSTDTTVAVNQTITFWGEESINAFSWEWDFGDASPVSNLKNAGHSYASPGTYTVTLTVTNPCGQDIEQKLNFIVVQ